jgi:nucleoid-associated protein YgaU
MIVILGLVVLVAALIAGVAGVLANGGHAHAVTHFAVFGYHVTGSTGTLFLYGIVVGALAVAGLTVLLAGARRTSRRGRDARRGLAESRRETAAVSADRDDLRSQRDTARAYTVHDEQQNFTDSTLGDGGTDPNGTDPGLREPRLFARLTAGRPAPPQSDALASQAPVAQPEPPADQAAAVPAGASAPAD